MGNNKNRLITVLMKHLSSFCQRGQLSLHWLSGNHVLHDQTLLTSTHSHNLQLICRIYFTLTHYIQDCSYNSKHVNTLSHTQIQDKNKYFLSAWWALTDDSWMMCLTLKVTQLFPSLLASSSLRPVFLLLSSFAFLPPQWRIGYFIAYLWC